MNFLKHLKENIGKEKFVTFSNVDEFPQLSAETADLLKNYGVPNSDKMYPFLTTDGMLKTVNSRLVQIGEDIVGEPFCIDTENDQFVLYTPDDQAVTTNNSSFKKYLETFYAFNKYNREVEFLEIFGKYWDNHKTYARKFREMLEEVEPDIMTYEIWYVQWHEKDLGVL